MRLAELEAERDAMLASTSWRITAPLRFFGHQTKRVIQLLRLIPSIVRQEGGVGAAAGAIHEIFAREGIRGFKGLLAHAEQGGRPGGSYRVIPSNRCNYAAWVRRYDTFTDENRTTLREQMASFPHMPLISLLMPVYNPKPEWLAEAVESVRRQLYPRWELCIADDHSSDPRVLTLLQRLAVADPRIRVAYRHTNGHISAASNSALELASGEYIGLLDHDDVLAEHALFWVADAINRNPAARLIYSDEDKLNLDGVRCDPYFKCDWNPDLFYSHNMICHLGVYRTELVRELGGFRRGFEGAQDYDLALRCIEQINPEEIVHIPRVLYHWRVHAESTARRSGAKPYSVLAGERALNEHLQRRGVRAHVEATPFGMYRIHYDLPESLPKVSLIIPTRNGLHLIRQCVESILSKTTYPNYEILIVDNGSDDPDVLDYMRSLEANPSVCILRDDRPFNYSALNNAAVKFAQGELVGLLNNDIEAITPEWLSEMVSLALQPGVGAVGARLWYPDDTLQHGGVIIGVRGVAGHSHKRLAKGAPGYIWRANLIQSLSAVTAACLVIRKSIYEAVGGLNAVDLPVAFNDVDFCLRVRNAGYRNVWTPYAELYHHESATRGSDATDVKKERAKKEIRYMHRKWGRSLKLDPAYSPNLTLEFEDFSFAWPPRLPALAGRQGESASEADHSGALSSLLSREDKALFLVNRKGLGLEIGQGYSPIAPRRSGFNVHVLDHLNAQELRDKYAGHGVDLSKIEFVDFVWKGEALTDLVGGEAIYDYVIASHVIEGTPDLISFLMQCERLLKPDGVLSLIIPDKRYCFDYFNPVTSTGDILDAYHQARTRPTPGKVFDHFANAAKCDGYIAWAADISGDISLAHTEEEVSAHWQRASSTEDYIDVHNWRFTPASFRLILHDLRKLGLIKLHEKAFFETEGCEFYVTLGFAQSAKHDSDRLKLAIAARNESLDLGGAAFRDRHT